MNFLDTFSQYVVNLGQLRFVTCGLICGYLLTACVSNRTVHPDSQFRPETIEKFNELARKANPFLYPRDDKPFSTGLKAVLSNDSHQAQRLLQQLTKIGARNLDLWEKLSNLRRYLSGRGSW